jgi:hypothetical protein
MCCRLICAVFVFLQIFRSDLCHQQHWTGMLIADGCCCALLQASLLHHSQKLPGSDQPVPPAAAREEVCVTDISVFNPVSHCAQA